MSTEVLVDIVKLSLELVDLAITEAKRAQAEGDAQTLVRLIAEFHAVRSHRETMAAALAEQRAKLERGE